MFKIVALGVLGYAAYRYFGAEKFQPSDIRLAGGPLSDKASLQKTADLPPDDGD